MLRIWVVEMLNYGRWEPTMGVQLTRDEARPVLAGWKKRNPVDRFRLRQYTPAPHGTDIAALEASTEDDKGGEA